jgi:hypothetical protein
MMETWDDARAKLYSRAQELLVSGSADFESKKGPLREALRDLCAKTEVMNREYTLRALNSIADEVQGGSAQPAPVQAIRAH